MRTLGLIVLLAATARAEPLPAKACPADWLSRRQGGCWTTASFPGEGEARAYVHPGGWVVDPRCLKDPRFAPGAFVAALDVAARKMDPGRAASDGGCLATFNPAMARDVTDAVWARPTLISCGAYDPMDKFCADNEAAGAYDQIRVLNVKGCMGPDTTDLAGTLFHETLHAAKIDNWPVERHNAVSDIPQYQFVRDRVYGTEAVCFFGTEPATRKRANLLQCLGTISYENDAPDRALCEGFDTYFGDLPPSTAK